MHLGKNIKRIRKSRGLTLEETGLIADLDSGNLSKLENGRVGWSMATLEALAHAFKVSVRDFFLTEEEAVVLAFWETLADPEKEVVMRMAKPSARTQPRPSAYREPEIDDDEPALTALSRMSQISRPDSSTLPVVRLARVHRPLPPARREQKS